MKILYGYDGSVSQTIGDVGGSGASSSSVYISKGNVGSLSGGTYSGSSTSNSYEDEWNRKSDAEKEIDIARWKREDEAKEKKDKEESEKKKKEEEIKRKEEREKELKIKKVKDRYAKIANKDIEIPMGWHKVEIISNGEVYGGFVSVAYNTTHGYFHEDTKIREQLLPQGKISKGIGHFNRFHSEVWENTNVIEKIYTGSELYTVYFLDFLENPKIPTEENGWASIGISGNKTYVFNTKGKEVIEAKYYYEIFARNCNSKNKQYIYIGEVTGYTKEEMKLNKLKSKKWSPKNARALMIQTNAEKIEVLIVLVKVTKKGNVIQYALPTEYYYKKDLEYKVWIDFSKNYPIRKK